MFGAANNSTCSFRVPTGWVVVGPLPPFVASTSLCYKCVVEGSFLADQIKSWYELKSYCTFKQIDACSAADKHAYQALILNPGERDIVLMLWINSLFSLESIYCSSHARYKTSERRLGKDFKLPERYAGSIIEDITNSYVVTVEAHDPHKRSGYEWYYSHLPVVSPNKPVKVCRVLIGVFKFHGPSLNKFLLVGPDLLEN